jgi:hypothetical protein
MAKCEATCHLEGLLKANCFQPADLPGYLCWDPCDLRVMWYSTFFVRACG